jgi:hypothetical protein
MNSANPTPSQPGYQPSALPSPSHVTLNVAQPANNPQLQNQIASFHSNLLITLGAMHLIIGFIPLIPIAFTIGNLLESTLVKIWLTEYDQKNESIRFPSLFTLE